MFAVMQKQHQEQLNQMKERNKQDLKMAQQSMKKMAEQIMVMYNTVQVAEKYNAEPNKEKGRRRQIKKIQCIQKGKHNCVKTSSMWHAILKGIFLSSTRMRNIGRPIVNPGLNKIKWRQIEFRGSNV